MRPTGFSPAGRVAMRMGSLQSSRRGVSMLANLLGLVAIISGVLFMYFGVTAGAFSWPLSINLAYFLGGLADAGAGVLAILKF